MPPIDLDPKLQEAFMTLNLLRDEPKYIIEKILEPAKSRFFQDHNKPYIPYKSNTIHRFNTYSYGPILT